MSDLHTMTAMKVFKVPEKEVSKEMRRAAKNVNFMGLYCTRLPLSSLPVFQTEFKLGARKLLNYTAQARAADALVISEFHSTRKEQTCPQIKK